MSLFSDAASFVRAIHAGDFDAAGVFADWLDERGDKRGVLLRRRWKRWQKERGQAFAEANAKETAITAPWLKILDDFRKLSGTITAASVRAAVAPDTGPDFRFRRYVQKQFPLPEFRRIKPPHLGG
jgi:uncharacterized protein (TIGR02996 family)